jgi:hypothetical protein
VVLDEGLNVMQKKIQMEDDQLVNKVQEKNETCTSGGKTWKQLENQAVRN